MRRLLFMVFVALMLVPVAAWSSDTDFDNWTDGVGVANGWTAYTYAAPDAVYSKEATIKHNGDFAQKIDQSGGGEGGIYHQFDAMVGVQYKVSAWVNTNGNTTAYLGADPTGDTNCAAGTIQWTNSTQIDTWHELTLYVTATSNKVTVYCDAWACVAYWDQVSMVQNTPMDNFGPDPYNIYWESVYWQAWDIEHYGEHRSGNAMGHGQVLIDGDKSIISQGEGGVLLYRDQQIDGAAFVKSTPRLSYGWPANYATKGGTMLNGVIYSQDMFCRIHKAAGWDAPWDEPGFDTGRVESDSYGLVTDGTYLYCVDNPEAFPDTINNCNSKVYKWQIDPTTGAISNVAGWPKVIAGPHAWLAASGYYNGKIYAAESFRGRNIYEIDCDDGEYRTILNNDNLIPPEFGQDAWYMGQTARCGNILAYAGWPGYLITWELIDGVWTKKSCHNPYKPTGANYFLGLSLQPGPDGNGKYAWTSAANLVGFWDMFPTFTPVSLGEARNKKHGHPSGVLDAVVTKVGTGEYWIEDKDRSSGCRVVGDIAADAIGKLVTMTGSMNANNAGEKFFTPNAAPTVGAVADPVIKPVYVSGKSLAGASGTGLATDGMLIKITGKVNLFIEEVEGTQVVHVYADDGSSLATDRAGITGVEVIVGNWAETTGFEFLMGPAKAEVTGVLRLVKAADGTIVRRIETIANTDAVFSPM